MLKDRIHIGDFSVVAIGSAVFNDVEANTTVMGNPARITNEGTQGLLYAPSRQMAAEPKPAKEAAVCAEELTPDRVAALYWEAFSGSFPGVDINPVNFRFHDPGWDSIAQMKLICALEDAVRACECYHPTFLFPRLSEQQAVSFTRAFRDFIHSNNSRANGAKALPAFQTAGPGPPVCSGARSGPPAYCAEHPRQRHLPSAL